MKVVVVGPADAAAVAARWAPSMLPRLEKVRPYAGRPTELLVSALLGAGIEVELVTLAPSVSTELTMAEGALSVLIGPYRPHGRARDLFRAERRSLASLLAQTGGDLVHAHWTYEFAWSILTDPRPQLVTVHDAPLTVLRRMPDAYRAVRAAMAYRVRTGSFRGIAVSPYVAARWRRQMLDRRPLRIVPNFVAVRNRTLARAMTGGPRLVSVGDGGPLKNVRTLLRAFPAVRLRHPTASLHLIGSGLSIGDPLTRWAAVHRLDQGVTWLGRRTHASTLDEVAAADVVVHPSLEESFGMVVAEAMAMGLPVVGGRNSGAVPWLLGGGDAGVLVNVRSARSLAEGVLSVCEQPGFAERLGAAALHRINDSFSSASVLRAHLEIYAEMTSRTPSGVPAYHHGRAGERADGSDCQA